MAKNSEVIHESKSFASSKKNFGIENDKISKIRKGQIIEQIDDISHYLENPCKFYIILKGKVRVYFHKQGTVFKPIHVESRIDRENFKIDRLAPVDIDELQSFGDF